MHFLLRQRVMMDKVEVGLAFNSSRTVVTEDYTRQMKLEKVRSSFKVDVFGSLAVEIDGLYKVRRASGKRRFTVTIVGVAAIYNGPPATCRHNITWPSLLPGELQV